MRVSKLFTYHIGELDEVEIKAIRDACHAQPTIYGTTYPKGIYKELVNKIDKVLEEEVKAKEEDDDEYEKALAATIAANIQLMKKDVKSSMYCTRCIRDCNCYPYGPLGLNTSECVE